MDAFDALAALLCPTYTCAGLIPNLGCVCSIICKDSTNSTITLCPFCIMKHKKVLLDDDEDDGDVDDDVDDDEHDDE